jgi:hypothetical protein
VAFCAKAGGAETDRAAVANMKQAVTDRSRKEPEIIPEKLTNEVCKGLSIALIKGDSGMDKTVKSMVPLLETSLVGDYDSLYSNK